MSDVIYLLLTVAVFALFGLVVRAVGAAVNAANAVGLVPGVNVLRLNLELDRRFPARG
jgi:hypothetical protein